MIRIEYRNERASIFSPGPDQPAAWSIDFQKHERGFGYARTSEPSEFMQRLAVLVRNEVYPEFGPIAAADLVRAEDGVEVET